MELIVDTMASPIGEIRIISDGTNLRALDFEDYESRMNERCLNGNTDKCSFRDGKNPGDATVRLSAYFEGELEAISGLDVASNGSEFQQLVWRMLRNIPSGKTWSYGQLATAIGKPSASRAVGLANGSNPDRYRGAMPSCDRRRRQSYRLWWRLGAKTMAAAT